MRANLIDRIVATIARQHPAETKRELTWLAGQLGLSIQTVSSWKSRGRLPAEWHQPVARLLNMSVEQLTGDGPPPIAPWPFPSIPRELIDGLAPDEIGIVTSSIMQGLKQVEELRAVNGQFRKRQGVG